jgi:hypothetical protein
VNLLELKDTLLCLRSAQGVLASAPGVASIAHKEPLFGEAAQQIARLFPHQNFNQFWQQLSLDPLLIKTKLFRHHADLAYAQLQQLCQGHNLSDGVVVAAPSYYSRAQLSVLLGILKQCPFKTLALVDHQLLQAASTGAADCVLLDLQLHQAVLTSFRVVDGMLQKDRVLQVPSAGLLALHEAWSSAVVAAFLQQSRFDPTHSAETEQYIATQLPTWLHASNAQTELLIELNHKGKVYQARLQHAQFIEQSKALYARVERELVQLRGPQSALYGQASLLALPGLASAFAGIATLADDAALTASLQHKAALLKPAEALRFITKLPLAAVNGGAGSLRQPTHMLYQHEAIALPQGKLLLGTPRTTASSAGAYARVVRLPDFTGAVVLQRTLRGLSLDASDVESLRCNGTTVQPGHELTLGDTLQVGPHVFKFIAVE